MYFRRVELPKFENIMKTIDALVDSKNIVWSSNQICLNTTKEHLNDTSYGTGSLHANWSNMKLVDDQIRNVELKKSFEKEENFTELCEVFYNTEVEDLYKAIKTNFNVGRIRIMKNLPHTCLSWHRDDTCRLHYPLITTEQCRMVIEEQCIHLPKHEWWITNTVKHHTAFNGSKMPRIHIVASLLDYDFNTTETV